MSFTVDTIDLSMTSPETGEFLTANVYYVAGVKDGDNLRPLSIGQLVMALCLQRAADLENQIVGLMDTMNLTSEQLTIMTNIEKQALSDSGIDLKNGTVTYNGTSMTYYNFLTSNQVVPPIQIDSSVVPNKATASSTDFITALEAKMDDKNAFSQQTMIELQSLTNKRDQSYDMISNILKSLGTVMTGIVNNT